MTGAKKYFSLLSLSTKYKNNITIKIRKTVENWPGDGLSVSYMLDL